MIAECAHHLGCLAAIPAQVIALPVGLLLIFAFVWLAVRALLAVSGTIGWSLSGESGGLLCGGFCGTAARLRRTTELHAVVTHVATAMGISACGQGKRVRFFRVTELITLLLEAREERQLLRFRAQLAKQDLLILDELGYVPASKAGAELLFDIISTAYERQSLLVTTNLPFENWTEVLGSERLTGATLDRLTHRCHILETKGESYRLKDAKRRRKPNGKKES